MKGQNLIPFVFEQQTIRTLLDEKGEPWFVAMDVAEALGYIWKGASGTIPHVPEEWKGVWSVQTIQGVRELLCLSEPGLYFFVCRSDKPKALPFQMWLAGDVVPSIRKTGQYQMMISQFLLADPRDWERLFPFDYYHELCRLFGWEYEKHRPLPNIIGRITWDWVYQKSLPVEALEELRKWKNTPKIGGRRRLPKPLAEGEKAKPYQRPEKLHQLLTIPAMQALFSRLSTVTTLARQSTDPRDFFNRCRLEWGTQNSQLCLKFPYEGRERLQPPRRRPRHTVNLVTPASVHADLFAG